MHKYLPEQRVAYVGMAVIILLLILSGLLKTYENIYAPDLSHTALLWATWMHNIGFILFFLAFLAHMAAIALRPNWPMVRGIFTGKVRLDYARHRHSLWLDELDPPVMEAEATVQERQADDQIPKDSASENESEKPEDRSQKADA